VRFEAERGREGLQRQLAALDGHAHVLAQRLEDAELEKHALEHRVRALNRAGVSRRAAVGPKSASVGVQLAAVHMKYVSK